MWIDDTEIMRLSTAEPTYQGIVSYITKDLTQYVPAFKDTSNNRASKRFIFDLGNIVNEVYNAPIHVTVDAYFWQPTREGGDHQAYGGISAPAQRIIPVSAQRGVSEGKPSAWHFPNEKAETKFRISRKATRAVLTVAATGQGAEEFWWSNVPESASEYFKSADPNSKLPGLSSFREVRVYIDDREAGYAWPFPVVFTGGISPSLHRPVAGIQAFDLRENEIDLTPWLGFLCDDKEHVIRMEVWGVDDSDTGKPVFQKVGDHWILSGKIFVWQDKEEVLQSDREAFKNSEENPKDSTDSSKGNKPNLKSANPKGYWGAEKRTEPNNDGPTISHSPIDYKSAIEPLGAGCFQYTQSITRKIVSETKGGNKNKEAKVRSTQEYEMQNTGVFRDWAQTQEAESKYTGGSHSTHRGEKNLATRFTYEIGTVTSYKTTPEVPLNLDATLSHRLELAVTNHSPLVEGAHDILQHWGKSAGTIVKTWKDGTSTFTQRADGTTEGWGSTTQDYTISAMDSCGKDHIGTEGEEWYRRELEYKDNQSILDKQYYMGKEATLSTRHEGFEPAERDHFSHTPSDYAPFPLIRGGIPNIYLRDRLAVDSSTSFRTQKMRKPLGDISHLELTQKSTQI